MLVGSQPLHEAEVVLSENPLPGFANRTSQPPNFTSKSSSTSLASSPTFSSPTTRTPLRSPRSRNSALRSGAPPPPETSCSSVLPPASSRPPTAFPDRVKASPDMAADTALAMKTARPASFSSRWLIRNPSVFLASCRRAHITNDVARKERL